LTEADLFQLLSDVYEENPEHKKNPDIDKFESNHIEFHIFLRMLEHLFRILDENNREQDFIDTFVSFGGNSDKTGKIAFDHIKKVCEKFGLTVDIQQMISKMDTDGNGNIDYAEFKKILTTNQQ
jgi:calmodulin